MRLVLLIFPARRQVEVWQPGEKAWAAKLRRQRHIGDFSRWKDYDAYQQAFARRLA